MASKNEKIYGESVLTQGGLQTYQISNYNQLRRSVCANLLWENVAYEDGVSVAKRIGELVPKVKPGLVAALAIEAREEMNLRHVPLLLVREMVKYHTHKYLVAETLTRVIQRADEITEFLAIYWADDPNQPIAASVKKGLADAFHKFDEYEFAKYNRAKAVKLRDVLRLVHPKPSSPTQAALFGRIKDDTLATPFTWEVELSKNDGRSKREKWEQFLRENKLGAMALLRNLRNFTEQGVDDNLVHGALNKMNGRRVLPFRYIAAAKAAPRYESEIDAAMLRGLGNAPKLPGKTIIVIDVSGSMYSGSVSKHSDMNRALAACALGAIARELCENPVIYATAGSDSTGIHQTQLVPNRRGMALVDAIFALSRPLGGGGIFLTPVLRFLKAYEKTADRIIVITDEQDTGHNPTNSPKLAEPFGQYNYLINVSVEKNGVGYGQKWVHLDGFSEGVFKYILEVERNQN